jgi:hypothetical protein
MMDSGSEGKIDDDHEQAAGEVALSERKEWPTAAWGEAVFELRVVLPPRAGQKASADTGEAGGARSPAVSPAQGIRTRT